MAEQKYQAVLAVIAEGRTIAEVATQWRVSRRTRHRWLARYELEDWKVWPNAPTGPGAAPTR